MDVECADFILSAVIYKKKKEDRASIPLMVGHLEIKKKMYFQ